MPDVQYTDTSFAWPYTIRWPDLPSADGADLSSHDETNWVRISEEFKRPAFTIWGDNGIRPEDAIQGSLGNCWLVSSAMSIAEKPERLKNMFLIDKKNSANVYALKMYALGVPVTVTIDDYLPIENDKETLFARVSKDGALWGPILEKAFAKFLGNYENLEGGLSGPGIRMMTGSPFVSYWHNKTDADSLWQILTDEKAEHSMITAGSYIGTGSDKDTNEVGLAYSHAYSILETIELSTGDRLLALRNPWAREAFNGTWSDTSDAWTDELREEANHLSNNDGKFFISIEDYIKYLEYTTVSFDVSEAYQAYFLRLNDDYVKPAKKQNVSPNCTTHTFVIESEIDQEILISAHTWDNKHYLADCMKDSPE